VVQDLFASLREDGSASNAGSLEVVVAETAEDLLTMMAGMDFVVASRLHGVILSHLVNRPTIAISYDRKVTTYMRDAEQAQFCLDIHRIDCQSLANVFQILAEEQGLVKDHLARKTAEYRQSLSIQFDRVLSCLD
jgi:polysaccharide pyruvyl transferase WcaK-like protein